ncbi:MAG: dihydrofolate reductase [Lachnospiraceae bacterium]|nr:dihydrofolate reductase [Lachnospiraceae bacterium]MBD5481750.1 dihydrofolate reductase [Lachnospiraceae bacterium]
MNMIVAVDANWAIGNKGKLLVSIPNDHKMFREMTTGKVIVYGRKTLMTFPQEQPLTGRTNLILSANPSFTKKGAQVFHSEDELLDELKKYDDGDVFIVGGESVYRLMLPYCDTVHVTKIDHTYAADAYFPNLDESQDWEITADSDEHTYFDIPYTFYRYERKNSMIHDGGADNELL